MCSKSPVNFQKFFGVIYIGLHSPHLSLEVHFLQFQHRSGAIAPLLA